MSTARGSDWLQYDGDPEKGTARPFGTDHAPVIGLAPRTRRPRIRRPVTP